MPHRRRSVVVMAAGICGNGWPDGIKYCTKAVRVSGVRIQGQQRSQNEILLWRVERVGRCGWGEVVKMNRFEQWWAGTEQNLGADIKENMVLLSLLKRIASSIWEAFDNAAWGEWQPIETAPKGAYSLHKDDPEWVEPPRILLSTPEGVVIAQWDYYYDGSVGGHGYCGNDSAWVTDEGELVCDTPMYWMPLPQPPK